MIPLYVEVQSQDGDGWTATGEVTPNEDDMRARVLKRAVDRMRAVQDDPVGAHPLYGYIRYLPQSGPQGVNPTVPRTTFTPSRDEGGQG